MCIRDRADIAVANTYYLALMLSGKKGAEQQAAAKKVKAFFPNQNGRGTHMNVSCAALVKGAQLTFMCVPLPF